MMRARQYRLSGSISAMRACGLCAAAICAAWLVVGCGSGGSSDSGTGAKPGPSASDEGATVPENPPPNPRAEGPLSAQAKGRAAKAALSDRQVQQMVSSRGHHIAAIIPWSSSADPEYLGGTVSIKLETPITLRAAKFPIRVEPSEGAPAGTPTLQRSYRVSATGVSELRVKVELQTERVVEIVPAGAGIQVSEMKLLGPRPGKEYRGVDD